MKTYKILLIIVGLFFSYSCEKELSITEFSDDFSNYEPELKIEALILPTENTAIVRVDKSVLITDISLYNCIDNSLESPSGKLLKETNIVLEEQTQIFNTILQHGNTLNSHSQCKS